MANIFIDIFKNIFPKRYCVAFAYGSSMFKQYGHISSKNTMLDFILAVENPVEWHKENIKQNPTHYSLLKYCGPENIAKIQDLFGAKVYFNSLVPTYAGLVKYGVVSRANLISDLLDWESLYIAGRLHKPVNILHLDDDKEMKTAMKINLYAALHTALLLLPDTFTEQQLYLTVAGLSYSGDFRMLVGEDRNKVQNIVSTQMAEFRKLYYPVLLDLKDYALVDYSKGTGEQDVSAATKLFHLSMLPKMLQLEVVQELNKDGRSRDLEDVLRVAAMDPDANDIVLKGVCKIVQASSLSQSLKGILTAGPVKSVKYSVAKLNKMLNSSPR